MTRGAGGVAAAKATRSRLSRTRAKLAVPPLPGGYLSRPRLVDLLDDAYSRRLTTVVAGPGFGKSTLLAAWANEHDSRWYTVDRRDATLIGFARGIAGALGLGAVRGLADEAGDERARAEPLAELISDVLGSRLDHEAALVLDDAHELRPRSPSARLLEALCRQAPPELHLVLASREDPPFAIERLRGRGQVLALDAAALAFTTEEIAFLVGDDELAERLQVLTEGWPAAVRLGVDALRRKPGDTYGSVLDGLAQADGPLFPYLAEEVFAGERPAVRRLLRAVAELERFSPALCEALGLQGAERTLSRLEKRGLFVHRSPDGSYTLHALVREFARARWRLAPEELRTLSATAASWFEQDGQVEEALRLATAASDPSLVSRILREHAVELEAHGAATDILRAAAALTPEYREPAVELVVGQAHAVRGQWDEAAACYAHVAGESDELPAVLAWRIGRIHRDRGESDEELAVYDRARVDGSDPSGEALLLASKSLVHWRRGTIDEARDAAVGALDGARACGDERAEAAANYALALIELGRDEAASAQHARRSLEFAERAGDMLQEVKSRLMVAVPGPAADAVEIIEPAIRLAEVAGAEIQLADALYSRGFHRYDLGQLDGARADYERCRSIFERLGSMRIARPLVALGGVFRERGDLALARGAFADALAVLERGPDPAFVLWAKGGLACVVAADDPERAEMLAADAVEVGGSTPLELPHALLMNGWVALASGHRERAAQLASEAEERCQQTWALPEMLELRAVSAPDATRELPRLAEAAAICRELHNPLGVAKAEYALARLSDPPDAAGAARAKRKLRALGIRESAAGAAGLLMALGPERPPALAVQTLGAFRVLRGGIAVPAAEWRSKKARDLLKLLVAARGRSVPREVLIEALWPDDDPRKTANRFSVALSTLRAVLDPGHEHPPEHYVTASEGAVAVDPGRIVVDSESFRAEAEAGLAACRERRSEEARELLEAAEAAYGGDFLEEDLYDEWASTAREELRSMYVQVARALSYLTDDPRVAARYRRRILEREPYDEQTHLELVAALVAGRAQGEARRAYRSYAARMEELGIEPSPFPV